MFDDQRRNMRIVRQIVNRFDELGLSNVAAERFADPLYAHPAKDSTMRLFSFFPKFQKIV